MSPSSLPIPDFQDAAQNLLRDEILGIIEKVKVQYDKSIVGVVSHVPIYFNFGSVSNYNASERLTVLRNIKTNVNAICKQFETSMDKMDALNKANVNNYLLRMVVNNAPGKASTSKKCTFFPDGTCEITTVFEDGLNCQYYLEKKVLQTLNEFRPATGSQVIQKVEAFVQPTTPPPVEPVVQQVVQPTSANVDLSVPNYQNGTWEQLKGEIVAICSKGFRLESVLPGPPFDMPVGVDWMSIGLSGGDYLPVLKSIKNNIAALLKQIVPGIQKVDEFRKPIIRDFLITIILQNVAGKASTSKKAFLTPEGSLVLQVPFEDNLNCSYYFEKKITQGLNEFAPPQGVTGLPRATVAVQQPVIPPPPVVVQQPSQPVFAPTYGTGQFQQAQPPVVVQPPQPVYQQPVVQQPVYHQPIYHQPVVQQPTYTPQFTSYEQPKPVEPPKPVYEPPKAREPPKPKGRAEMEEKPAIEDPINTFLVREIEFIISKMKVVDDRDQEFGVPIYLDWKSVMVYPSPVKQASVIRNINLVIYRLLRDVVQSIKLSCTDGINKDNIIEYLRSVTVQHFQGSSPSLKKVVYEDGHLSIQTTFEDFGNCALYFESKVIQAFNSKPTQPTPKKIELLALIKEELPIRLMAHQNLLDKKTGKQITPVCPVEMDFSFLTVKGNEALGAEHNLIASTNPLLADLFAAIVTFNESEIAILMKEITKITFQQAAPGKTIFDKRHVIFLDNGNLQIITTFEDKMEGVKTFKEKFVNIFKSRLFKVQIRDRLVPEIREMVNRAVKVQYKDNYLDVIPVQEFKNYSSMVAFDWQLVDKEPIEHQVPIYRDIVKNLEESQTFRRILRTSIEDICSYDVGKNAFLPNVNFILRNIIKAKEEQIKFVGGTTWEFYIAFHDVANNRVSKASLTTMFKEKLSVAFPCAIQDTFPVISDYVEEFSLTTGKKVPIVIHYDDFRKFSRFTDEQFAYQSLNNICCKYVKNGLDCISLTKDVIVKKEYTNKVNTIEIHYDVNNKVSPQRPQDPNAIAKLSNGVLTVTINFAEAKNETRNHSWDFQFEYVLGTRPLKIARAIENAKHDLGKTTTSLSNHIGKPVTIAINYDSFITNPKFQLDLEEPVYTKVILSFYALVEAGWLNSAEAAELVSYDSVKKSFQSQLTKITFYISCDSSLRSDYEFNLESGGNLVIGLNLHSACKILTQPWRLELERVFKLRDLKIQEEIAVRIKVDQFKNTILSTIGKKSITITIDWQSIITNPDFSINKLDYIKYLHQYSEGIMTQLAATNGFGKLCQYEEVTAIIQSRLNSITLQGSNMDGFNVRYDSVTKGLILMVGIRNLYKNLSSSAGNYEEYGRKMENEIGVRVDCIKAFIKRNEPQFINDTKSRLAEATETQSAFSFDWASIIEHPNFARIQDPVPTLRNILALSSQLHPLVQLCKENFEAKGVLKTIRSYTISIDGSSRIDEAEFAENKYGVDWAKISWKNLPDKTHILFSANLDELSREPRNLEIHLKVEALVTPDRAHERYQQKMDEIHRQEERDDAERFRRDQMRMDQKMLDASRENNRQLENLNRKFRR